MVKIRTPQLIISDHYDDLVREIDLHTEQLLERFTDNDLLDDHWNISDHQDDPIKDISEWNGPTEDWLDLYPRKTPIFSTKASSFDLKSIKVKDYLQKVRADILKELSKAQQDNLDFLEENKTKFRIDSEKMSDPETQELLRKDLFSHKFCFIVSFNNQMYDKETSVQLFFGRILIVTDFYISPDEIEQIKKFNRLSKTCSKVKLFAGFRQEFIWPVVVRNFIFDSVSQSKADCYLVHLSRNQVLEQYRKIDFYSEQSTVDLSPLEGNHFSRLTHLTFVFDDFSPNYCQCLINLHALPASLEYLKLFRMEFVALSFPFMPHLLYLHLIECDFGHLKADWLSSFPTLRLLQIEHATGLATLRTECLSNLTHLGLYDDRWPNDFFTQFQKEQQSPRLQVLDIRGYFDDQNPPRIQHSNLSKLELICYNKKKFDTACLSGLPNLRRLCLSWFEVVNLEYVFSSLLEVLELNLRAFSRGSFKNLRFLDSLTGLKCLTLTKEDIEISVDYLGELPCLTSLELFADKIARIEPRFFSIKPNLERLKIKSAFDPIPNLEMYSSLSNLKELDLTIEEVFALDLAPILAIGPFVGLTSLKTFNLKLERNFFLAPDAFAGLDNLESLTFSCASRFEKEDLRIFLALKRLRCLDLTGMEDFGASRRDLVEFLANQKEIKTIWHSRNDSDGHRIKRKI